MMNRVRTMCRLGQRRVMSTTTDPTESASRLAMARVFLRQNPEVVSAIAAGVGATVCGIPIAYTIFDRTIARGNNIDLFEVAFCVGVAGLGGGATGYLVRKALQNWEWVGLGAACLTPFAAATAIGGSAAYIANHHRKKAASEALAAKQAADKVAIEEKQRQEQQQAAAKQREMAVAAVFDAGLLAGFTRNRRFNYESYDEKEPELERQRSAALNTYFQNSPLVPFRSFKSADNSGNQSPEASSATPKSAAAPSRRGNPMS